MESTGTHTSALDSKGRINIPVKVRKNLLPEDDNTYMLSRGKGKFILMRPISIWNQYMDEVKEKLGSGQKYEMISRHLSRDSSRQTLDKQGRLNLTKKLIDYAELDGEVEIHTFDNRIELWKGENFEEHMNATQPDADKIREEHDI